MSNASGAVVGGDLNTDLISADIASNDSLWRVLSLIDPFRFAVDDRYLFVNCFAILRSHIAERYELPPDEADEIAKPIARFLSEFVRRLDGKKRPDIDNSIRVQLVEVSDRVHCWYCGAHFPEAGVEAFVARKQKVSRLPPYVDFVTRRGNAARDMQIEVDHILPVASGGGSDVANLRLACGWCNQHKRELQGIYDSRSMPAVYSHPRSGRWLVPAPYWVVRVLGTRRRCEWLSGCSATVKDGQLYVAPRNHQGSMTPGNLGVFCQEHDPLVDDRLVPNSALLK